MDKLAVAADRLEIEVDRSELVDSILP
jgi:hypothetical protein